MSRIERGAVLIAVVVSTFAALPAKAQSSVPVVFLPGLGELNSIWDGASSSLEGSFNITPGYKSYTTSNSFLSQRSTIGSVDTTAVLVGHSAGGVLARYAAQNQKLRGVITYGTPNYGAPIVETYPAFCDFIAGTIFDAGAFAWASHNYPGDYEEYVDVLEPDFDYVVEDVLGDFCDYVVNATTLIGSTAGDQLSPDGGFINDTLNLSTNITTEQAHLGLEASVVNVTDNFYDSGAFQLAWPDGSGLAVGHIVQYLGADMVFDAAEIYLYGDPDDAELQEIGVLEDEAGEDLLFIDEAWCETVGGSYLLCWDNDEVVPVWSQDLGFGTTFTYTGGPVHTLEAQNATSNLSAVFTGMGIGT